jgi:predicted transcriptional regulator
MEKALSIESEGGPKMQNTSVIEQAHRLLDTLPDSTTWEDLMYRIYVRQAIEEGLRDSDAGQTVDVEEVRKRFGLSS